MDIFASRRDRFAGAMEDGVALIPSYREQRRNADIHHRFRPESDFYYLTGFGEPDAILLLCPQHPDHKVVLFVRSSDQTRDVWTGKSAGIHEAVERFGADAAYPVDDLEKVLPDYLLGARRLYYRLGQRPDLDPQVAAILLSLRHNKRRMALTPTEIIDPTVISYGMRVIKDLEEIAWMRKAAAISCEAHKQAMAHTHPGMAEYELESLIDFCFRQNGGEGPSYPTIVAGGENATTLHYTRNNATLKDGDLVLIDAGCEYRYYAADITRTYPVNGRFSPIQREVYHIVLEAQEKAIARVAPGVSLEEVHEVALRILTEGMVLIGVLNGDVDELIASGAYRPFFMHRTSHWLGLDVHDSGEYQEHGQSCRLKPGMVLTIEPGLYFASGKENVPRTFRGLGIRVEDDVLVTSEGHEVLTAGTPKTIPELEELAGQATHGLPTFSMP